LTGKIALINPDKKEYLLMSFSDLLRQSFKSVLVFFGKLFTRMGLSPNMMTLIALAGSIVASILIATKNIQLGGLMVLIMGPLDAVDGAMARVQDKVTLFGAFLDSISDRYSELFILGGLLYYFIQLENWQACLLVYIAAAGSILVSYIRARGEALGFSAKAGILTRVERYLVMAPSLIFNVPLIGLWVIAIFGNLTAIQRIWQVWNHFKKSGKNN
jgi:CDP-diacylglycerol--glycerol-3-phosphate 3-phosphatidyltransferase